MSEGKKIGASKYKTKQKYKNKAKVVSKIKETDGAVDDGDKIVIDNDYPFRRRGLESNWHRYEESKDEAEDIVDVAKDFSAIVSAPISQGHYFQFKSDRNLDTYEEDQIESEIFRLDMELLSLSLLSIPFHRRCNIDEKYFSEDVLNVNNAKAEKAQEQYEKTLKEMAERKLEGKGENGKVERGETIEDKDEIANKLTSSSLKKDSEEGQPDCLVDKEKEDLEKWLDNILDD